MVATLHLATMKPSVNSQRLATWQAKACSCREPISLHVGQLAR